jgi:hypothetical protein
MGAFALAASLPLLSTQIARLPKDAQLMAVNPALYRE